ncbi:MAG: AI-2E family transporter [Verrucomicrobiota bacterium]|nr:AI-2E family transporter [Verrucomicrobiota bacterium]
MKPQEFPTAWQQKTIWAALTTLAVVAIGAVAVGLIWLGSQVLGFLQPILIPFAIAGVMAYLLEPMVAKIASWGLSRHQAVMIVFAAVTVAVGGILLGIVPAISDQTSNLIRKVPRYSEKVRTMVVNFARDLEAKYGIKNPLISPPASDAANGADEPASAFPPVDSPGAAPSPEPLLNPEPAAPTPATVPVQNPDQWYDLQKLLSGDFADWVRTALPAVVSNVWQFITKSVGGFLGVFGFLLSMIIVPIYLYYFLIESRKISESWGDYLPLRASAFKDEVVSLLEEINGYLIAFFRGQLVVSLINGTVTGVLLVAIGLDFGLLIGLLLCVLGLIPYLGIILCWVPAVIIASVQGGSWLIPATPWWAMPLVVTVIFFVWQQIDGLFITPKVVGETVGLHPMTVIVSVFVWSLLMGGLLGAILAVPMTATLKVLLKRYIWERRILGEMRVATEESFALQQAQEVEEPEAVTSR